MAVSVAIRFLGTGDAFGDGGRLQACFWLRAEGYQVLLDCGVTSVLAMKRDGIVPPEIDAVVLSHFHGDHAGGIPYLVLEGQFHGRTKPLTIAGPPTVAERTRESMEEAFRGLSRTAQRFEVRYVELGAAPATVGPLAVRALPVVHTPGSEAHGLRVVAGDRAVAYSGDTEWTDALALLAADADLFIAEAYSFEKRIPYHLSYRALEEHRAAISAKRIVLTHPGPETLARLGEVKLDVASDGMEIEL